MTTLWDKFWCLLLGHRWEWHDVGPFMRGVCGCCRAIRVEPHDQHVG